MKINRNKAHYRRRRRLWGAVCLVIVSGSVQSSEIFRDGFEFFAGATRFLVTWQDDADGNGFSDIRAGSDSAPAFERSVNSDAAGEQLAPVLAVAANGDFVVAWADDTDLNGSFQIHARGFDAAGNERFPTLTVNSVGAGNQVSPDIAMAPNGDFVVVWADDQDNNGFFQILGRGFSANGAQKFADITLNNLGAGDQRTPVVGMADDGSFVAAWADDQDIDQIFEISARTFNANGSPRLGQFQVNQVATGAQLEPAIGVGPAGDFVIAWRDDRGLDFYSQIRASAYDATGAVRFQDMTLNEIGAGNQYHPTVDMAADGSFVAAWVDQGQQIRGRAFAVNGTPRFGDLLLNDNRLRTQLRPSVAVADDSSFVVLWQELSGTGDWRLLGRTVGGNGDPRQIVAVASGRGGDQVLPRVVLR